MVAVFSYGSLIMPTSLIHRFDSEIREEAEKIKESRDENTQKELLKLNKTEKAIRKWEESHLEFVPVKIDGFKRYYALEWDPEGNQLVVEQTGDEEDFVNGVIVTGLTEEEYQAIKATEVPYNPVKLDKDRFSTYISGERLEEEDVELPEEIIVFVADNSHDAVNYETDQKRGKIYHKGIIEGVEMLAEHWFANPEEQERFKKDFRKDLEKTTYEMTEDGWETLKAIKK